MSRNRKHYEAGAALLDRAYHGEAPCPDGFYEAKKTIDNLLALADAGVKALELAHHSSEIDLHGWQTTKLVGDQAEDVIRAEIRSIMQNYEVILDDPLENDLICLVKAAYFSVPPPRA